VTSQPDGRLLLLEHGRSHYAWMNKILDNGEAAHMEKWCVLSQHCASLCVLTNTLVVRVMRRGCAWNRPIDELLEDEGLEIESVRRYHFGTTYMIVARPGRRKPKT
jgi:methyltransferase OMS1